MVTYYVSTDCVAAVLEKDEILCTDNLREEIASCLEATGLCPWADIEAELYSFNSRWLLIARPRSPVRQRVRRDFPRLKRR